MRPLQNLETSLICRDLIVNNLEPRLGIDVNGDGCIDGEDKSDVFAKSFLLFVCRP